MSDAPALDDALDYFELAYQAQKEGVKLPPLPPRNVHDQELLALLKELYDNDVGGHSHDLKEEMGRGPNGSSFWSCTTPLKGCKKCDRLDRVAELVGSPYKTYRRGRDDKEGEP
jgi:hypothetical protein